MAFYNGKGTVVPLGEGYNYMKWAGKELVVEGNSLTASTDWGRYLAEFLGMHETNMAQSGGAIIKNDMTAGYSMDDIKQNVASYPAKIDLLIMQGDTNIAQDGNVTDQMDGSDPKTTWCARMNYMIRCLRAKYPNIVIVLMPDSVRYGYNVTTHTGGSIQPYDWANNASSLSMMRAIAEYNRLNFWNFDGATPYNPNHDSNYYSKLGDPNDAHTTQDMVHPSIPAFVKAKGYALAHFVAGLVFDPSAPNDAIANWESFI